VCVCARARACMRVPPHPPKPQLVNQLADFQGTVYGPYGIRHNSQLYGFYFITICLQYGGHMGLCGGESTLALLIPLSPESNACSDMQKTGIEVGAVHACYIYCM
jgi:hypothetical protein